MGISRRAFLTGSVSGAAVLLLTACTPDAPAPVATATTPPATATPTPTAVPAGAAPVAVERSAWATDPYSLGATSYLTTGSSDTDRATLRDPVDDRLFLAGEATASSSAGTVSGARVSGFEVAEAVAAVASTGERIAVVGAGMAGATAARSLADRGFDVVVVEARDRVGGRVHSVGDDSWPFPVELGAGVPRGEAAVALRAALALAGVTTVPVPSTVDARTTAGTTTSLGDGPAAAVAAAAAWASRQPESLTVSQAVVGSGADAVSSAPDDAGVSEADRLAWLLDEAVPVRSGAGPDDLAVSETGGETGTATTTADLLPGGEPLVTGGLSSFVTAQLEGLDVLRGSTVVRLQHGDQGVGLRLATGESLSADRVVSTLPLGVLQAGTTEFAPELPTAHLDAVAALGVGHQEVVWLRFDEPFWSTEATVWALLDGDGPYRLFVNLMPATGVPVLGALTGGGDAVAALELDDDAAVAAIMSSLAPYLDLVAAPGPTGDPTDPAASTEPSTDGSAPAA